MSVNPQATGEPGTSAPPIGGRLARAFQEIFTVVVRVRSNRQSVSDAASFREHVKRLLADADAESRRAGYRADDVRMAVYATVAFLDEAVLNSSAPEFAGWPRQPLQEEVFGDHMAGETFFRNLEGILARDDSDDLADLLEVYQLCLLLGFRGRFASGGEGQIHRFTSMLQERLERIRRGHPPLAPSARPPATERVPEARDPWVRRLLVTSCVLVGLAVLMYLSYRLLLGTGEIATAAASVDGAATGAAAVLAGGRIVSHDRTDAVDRLLAPSSRVAVLVWARPAASAARGRRP